MKACKYILIFLLCVVMAFAPMLLACDHSPEWQEQFDLGMRYLEQGRYEEAILAFSAVIDINPKLPDAYRLRAKAYEEAAKLQEDEAVAEDYREKAREDREKAQELDPEPQMTTVTTAAVTQPPTTTAATETAPPTTRETTVETTAETRYAGARETEEYEDYTPLFTLPAPTFGTGLETVPTVTFPVFDPDIVFTVGIESGDDPDVIVTVEHEVPVEDETTAAPKSPVEQTQAQTTPTSQSGLSSMGTIEGITFEDEIIPDEGVAVG